MEISTISSRRIATLTAPSLYVTDYHPSLQEPHYYNAQLVDVADGLKYMHDLRVVHGDLKGVNMCRK